MPNPVLNARNFYQARFQKSASGQREQHIRAFHGAFGPGCGQQIIRLLDDSRSPYSWTDLSTFLSAKVLCYAAPPSG
ncbi:MAG: hypothetical protein ACO3GN_06230 [Bacteroidia bacterium]